MVDLQSCRKKKQVREKMVCQHSLSIYLMNYSWQIQKYKSEKVSTWRCIENVKTFLKVKVTKKDTTLFYIKFNFKQSRMLWCWRRGECFGHDNNVLLCRKHNKRFQSWCLIYEIWHNFQTKNYSLSIDAKSKSHYKSKVSYVWLIACISTFCQH